MKEKAKELVENLRFYQGHDLQGDIIKNVESRHYRAKQCALISTDDKFNGIIYVLGELKARGELSEKMYLKSITDLNKERQELKYQINKL